MGYLTWYTVEFSHNEYHVKNYIGKLLAIEREKEKKYLEKHSGKTWLDYEDPNAFAWNTESQIEWHNYERDVLKVSKKFPDVLITVIGSGENDEDKWVQYFKKGKKTEQLYAHIVITYPDFKDSDLMDPY